MTDEQIIAAAGEPDIHHWVSITEGIHSQWSSCTGPHPLYNVIPLYTADAILSAAKPLRDRIAELEANDSTMKAYYEHVFEDGGKRIAELTKQRDGAKFKLGDPVKKTRGSCWSGKVVGFYSTALTPEGYAVESSTEHGSVQIYPASALEHCATGGAT